MTTAIGEPLTYALMERRREAAYRLAIPTLSHSVPMRSIKEAFALVQLRHDFAANRRGVLAFLGFWLALLVVTGLTWEGGLRPPMAFTHLVVLPLLAGVATARFKLNSGIAGLVVSLIDLLVFAVVPISYLSLKPQPPMPVDAHVVTTWQAVGEMVIFAALFGLPGFGAGLLGGWLGRLEWRGRSQ